MIGNNKPYFLNLEAIRWIAALMVFLGHAVSPSYKYLPIKDSVWEKLLDIISDGSMGVSIFFVLSGFLITYLLIYEYQNTGTISLKKFYIRRVLRIWPLYYLVLAFSFGVYPLLKSLIGIEKPIASNILYHLTFLSNFDIIRLDDLQIYGSAVRSQDVTWSVSVEEQFYLIWPLFFIAFPKRLWKYLIVAVIIGSLIFRLTHIEDKVVLYVHSFSVMLDLGIGGLMAYFILFNKSIANFFQNSSTRTHLALFALSFCLVYWNEILFSFPNGKAISRFFISSSFALIISAQALTLSSSKLNLANWSFATRWGKYTYGIYLLHTIVMAIVELILTKLQISPSDFIGTIGIGIIEFLATLLISWLSYHYYERYFLKLKAYF